MEKTDTPIGQAVTDSIAALAKVTSPTFIPSFWRGPALYNNYRNARNGLNQDGSPMSAWGQLSHDDKLAWDYAATCAYATAVARGENY